MILGMSLETFTFIHTFISLIGIATGLVVLVLMLWRRPIGGWNAMFLLSTMTTSITGFFFPFAMVGPPHIVGVISLVVLAVALWALHGRLLAGAWRMIYAIAAMLALYLNIFVGMVQAFQKLTFFNDLAPTQNEPPFLVAQAFVLGVFIVLGFLAVRRFQRT